MESDNTWLKSNWNKNVDDENTVNSTLMIGHAFKGQFSNFQKKIHNIAVVYQQL